MDTADAVNGENDGTAHEGHGENKSGWEKEISHSGHEYEPTEETDARRAEEIRRDEEAEEDPG